MSRPTVESYQDAAASMRVFNNGLGMRLATILLPMLLVMACGGSALPTPKPTIQSTVAPTAAPLAGAAATPTTAPTVRPTAIPVSTPARQTTPTPEIKYGGTLVVGGSTEPPHWDPHQSNWTKAPTEHLYETLLYYEADTGEPQPRLAVKWEFSDPKTFHITLRQGVKFQNKQPVGGRELVADDVVYTMNRLRSPGPEFVWKSRLAAVDTIEAVDRYTVRFKFSNPYAPFLTYVGDTWNHVMAILPRETVERYGDLKNVLNQVGTGPFMIQSWSPGVGGSVVKNPDYWQKGKPYLDSIDYVLISDTATRIAAWRIGKVDYGADGWGSFSYSAKKDLARTNPDIQFTPIAQSYAQLLQMNLRRAPFTDIRVRKAIHLAVDRGEILNLAAAGGGHVSGFVSYQSFPGWVMTKDELLALPGYRQPKAEDLKDAKRLLAEAGYPNGITIDADVASGSGSLNHANMVIAAEQLKTVGITVRLSVTDFAGYLSKEPSGAFLFRPRGYAQAVEADDQFYSRYHTKGGRNVNGFSDPNVDQWLDAQRSEFDLNKRQQLTRQVEQRLFELVPHVPLFTADTYAARQARVTGSKQGPYSQWGRIEEIWINR